MNLANLSTNALLDGIRGLLGTERETLARLIAHLVEVEERRAHLEMACSSFFDFCVRKLGLSEGEAFRRINAARLVRRFPVILVMVASGRIHLSSLVLLRDHLDDSNHVALLDAASRKSKTEVQKLIAERFPRPDVPPSIRKLPERHALPTAAPPSRVASPRAEATLLSTQPSTQPPSEISPPSGESVGVPAPKRSDVVEPLAATRYRVQLTVGVELKDKLDRAMRLLGSGHPNGELASVIERGLDLLISSLEKVRLAKTERPRRARKAKHGYVTRATRREVVARDGQRCSFTGSNGERCPARSHLELDHRHPRALGGAGDAANVRLLCRAHNAFAAEQIFGKATVAGKIALRRRNHLALQTGDGARVSNAGSERTSLPTDGASAATPPHACSNDLIVSEGASGEAIVT